MKLISKICMTLLLSFALNVHADNPKQISELMQEVKDTNNLVTLYKNWVTSLSDKLKVNALTNNEGIVFYDRTGFDAEFRTEFDIANMTITTTNDFGRTFNYHQGTWAWDKTYDCLGLGIENCKNKINRLVKKLEGELESATSENKSAITQHGIDQLEGFLGKLPEADENNLPEPDNI